MGSMGRTGEDELADAYGLAQELSHWASSAIREAVGNVTAARTKRHAADWVTQTDEHVEQHVRARLLAAFPAHRVVGEEQGESGAASADGAPSWFLDPVDGTANFVHGLPWFSFSLGLVVDGEPALGVVADPTRGELLRALRGSGAFLNDVPITARSQPGLTGDLVLTELGGRGAREAIRALVPWLAQQHAILRVMGSSALSMASVGAGRAGALVLHRFQPWDVVAATAICREAGAVVEDGNGRRQGVPERGLVAGHAEVATRLWDILRAQPDGGVH
jgi:fructose-1,6-bisphosphatase/inositol monophosphatase family enzyme